MKSFLLIFSISPKLTAKGKEMTTYLRTYINDLELVSIDLQDDRFTISIKTSERAEQLVLNLLRLQGFRLTFIEAISLQ